MASWRFFVFLLLISSCIFLGFSQDLDAFLQETDSMVSDLQNQISPCVQKILPCQPYMKSPENPPPACCSPLKEMLGGDRECMCSFFNDAKLLKGLNVTQSEAMKLPKACGAEVDISACNHEAGANPPTSTGSTEAPLPPAKTSNGSDLTSKPNSSTRNNPTYGIIGYGFAAAFNVLGFLVHFN